MAISASDVKKLRDQTGAGMMDCKAALEEAKGNFEEATTILRKKGLASAAKKAGRATSEGLIGHSLSADNRVGHSRRGELRVGLRRADRRLPAAREGRARRNREGRRRARPTTWLKDPDGPVQQRVAAGIAKLGENMAVPRFVRYAGQGYVGQYIHMGGKIGVQVEFGGVTAGDRGARGVHDAGQGNRDADRGGQPDVRVARSGAGRSPREGARDLPRADGEFRQAGERHRQDRRGQAGKLLLAGRAARSAVDPRSEDDGQGCHRRGQQSARRPGRRHPLRAAQGRRSTARR